MTAHRLGIAAVVVGWGCILSHAQPPAAPPPPPVFGGSLPAPAVDGTATGMLGSNPGPGIPGSGLPAVDTLTQTGPACVPGTVFSPWSCGVAAGGSGVVSYEGYLRTGPAIVANGGAITDVIKTGWNVQGGARTLFFNITGDAAWVLDLGIGFTQNRGRREEVPIQAFTEGVFPQAVDSNGNPRFDADGQPIENTSLPRLPDVLTTVSVLGLRRTSLNFAIGRDYFLNGPGVVGMASGSNMRFGWDVGGRWGTTSLGYRPQDDPTGFRRRQDVYHGLFLGSQFNWERPFGSWTMIIGGRVEWSYYWMNILPPQNSNFRDVNLLMMFALRY